MVVVGQGALRRRSDVRIWWVMGVLLSLIAGLYGLQCQNSNSPHTSGVLGVPQSQWRPITKKKNPTLVSAISSRPFPTCPDELSPHRTTENRQNRFSTDDSCTRVAYARCRGNCVSCINPESRGAAKVIPVSLGAAGGRPSCARLATEHAGGGERRSRDASSPLDSRPDAAFDCIRRPVSFASICCCMVQRTFKARSPAH